jgi:hypothetical protein
MNKQRLYPLGYKVSHFSQARRLALASAQAAGALWEFRWGTTTGGICFVKKVVLKGVQIANATAEELRFNLKIARTFTASDDTNTASILRANDMQKQNGDFSDSILTAFRESSSATAAAGGTKTEDTDPIAAGSYVTIGTASTTIDGGSDTIFEYNDPEYPLRLEANEGWIINLEAAKGASTGFVLHLETAWAECTKVPTS